MDDSLSRRSLVEILRLAYSGERAAAYAYRGHWKSLGESSGERAAIRTIEEEEWHHRAQVGEMLRSMGEEPSRWLEIKSVMIGRTGGFLCHFTGWFAPMYGAGKLESRNIREYEMAARHARDCGHGEFIDSLLTMAEVEWDHEKFFREQVERHRWARRVTIWPVPPPRETIRESFLEESSHAPID